MKLALATLLILALVLSSSFLESTGEAASPSPSFSCDKKCGLRCSKAGYLDRCMTYCGICCNKCNCVPSGPDADKSECPCYRDLKNSKGTSKCP